MAPDMGSPASAPEAAPEQPWPSRAASYYSLFVLTIVVMFTVLDRQILALMIEPVKRDFRISDTQAALLLDPRAEAAEEAEADEPRADEPEAGAGDREAEHAS